MPSRPPAPLPLTDEQRTSLLSMSKSRTASVRVVQRAEVLLLAGEGLGNTEIARRVGVSRSSVIGWRRRFGEDGLERLGKVRPGRGRKPTISAERVEAIVSDTLHTKPPGETHWSCRSMALHAGVSPATVQRIWSARGIRPHLVETFKLSNDPRFEEKLVDVVGLYLNPPDKAVVLSVDEKSQIQALDRTQPSLPMKGSTCTSRRRRRPGSISSSGGSGRSPTRRSAGAASPAFRTSSQPSRRTWPHTTRTPSPSSGRRRRRRSSRRSGVAEQHWRRQQPRHENSPRGPPGERMIAPACPFPRSLAAPCFAG